MKKDRATWGSKIGFLLAAVGSAVGLGNIWGFPFKMGNTGGFAFLLVYIILAILVGYIIMQTELALGRKTKLSTAAAYHEAHPKFTWVGWLGVASPFLIIMFYFVLGAYCVKYMVLNFTEIFSSSASKVTGIDSFVNMITNPVSCIIFTLIFILVNTIIVKKGLSGGIEKFNKYGMPALALMLIIIIIRSVTLPGAEVGLKFMFKPDFSQLSSLKGLVHVLSVAGGQMFFSLSLAMGIMITYGSYVKKEESITKSSISIIFFDTLVALMAGVAVIPAAFALGGKDAAMAGPKLLFVTMQDVFLKMGKVGPIFGVIFFALVIIAALSSSISLTEVLVAFLADGKERKGKTADRGKITWIVTIFITIGAIIVAWDGLGSNGLWVPFNHIKDSAGNLLPFNDCWLDFLDCISEGIMMPLGALVMSILFGWIKKPNYILDEVGHSKQDMFYTICIKFIVPIAMLFILLGQISSFFNLGWF